ncbi:hypothetical protein APR41_10585 [Salegentibacter salinarum]|uniref:Sensory rhodopsin transducer n=1 Tax=Salegentibacter salinarum TaxID=447422 RepID=A0A2N0TNC5_9FLAO|nr:sensory rhodopsin transducer [Salegentibacter salinarum]PKD16225.1 hypothetical protein APR41_10585 [Salegentibacter salinarum]SKB67740.1 hypothetical protein SAMN05660903_01987 [Salegentibacter salinarum]
MKAIGKLDWAFSAGKIPLQSIGEEPKFTSNDKLAILNTSEEKAIIELFIFYENRKPMGPYSVTIKPLRLKKIRFNDLIDPEAIMLEQNYSCYIKTNVKVVIQFSRMNTGNNKVSEMSSMAFPVES